MTTKSQLTWRNLINTDEKANFNFNLSISFDKDIDEEQARLFIFNALNICFQEVYLEDEEADHMGSKAKPTFMEIK